MTIGSFVSADLIVSSLSTCFLLLVVLNMTKPLHIRKPVISVNNITVIKTLKDIILIVRVFFPFLNKDWQYMLDISDPAD